MSALGNLKYRTESLYKGAVGSISAAGIGFAVALVSWMLSWPFLMVVGLVVFGVGLSLAIFFWQLWYLSSFFSWTAEALVDSQEKQANRIIQSMSGEAAQSSGEKKAVSGSASNAGATHWVRTMPTTKPINRGEKVETVSDAVCLACGRRLNSAGRCPAGC